MPALMPVPLPRWKRYFHDILAAEVSAMTRYFDAVVQWARVPGDEGHLLERIDCPSKSNAEADLPDFTGHGDQRTAILLHATLNHHHDIQELLQTMRPRLSRTSRVILVAFNPYMQWVYRLAAKLGLQAGEIPTTIAT